MAPIILSHLQLNRDDSTKTEDSFNYHQASVFDKIKRRDHSSLTDVYNITTDFIYFTLFTIKGS